MPPSISRQQNYYPWILIYYLSASTLFISLLPFLYVMIRPYKITAHDISRESHMSIGGESGSLPAICQTQHNILGALNRCAISLQCTETMTAKHNHPPCQDPSCL